MNTKELCEAWNLSRQTIEQYRKLGMPFVKKSPKVIEYNYRECCEWRRKRKENFTYSQPKIKIHYKGEEVFLKHLCDELDLDYVKYYKRYKKYGDNSDKIFEECYLRVHYKGEIVTIKELSELTGIPTHTLYRRYRKYGDVEEHLIQNNCKKINYKGEKITYKEYSNRTGTPTSTLYTRDYRNKYKKVI